MFVPEIPMEAIREIVSNAFVHAKYSDVVTQHEVNIFPNRITIFNPGNLPLNLDPHEFVNEHASSLLRNPTIADVLFKTNRIEGYGTGYRRAFKVCDAAKVTYSYKNTLTGFEFTFDRVALHSEVCVSASTLTVNEQKVLNEVKENPWVTAGEIAIRINLGKRTIERILSNLQLKGKIVREGNKRVGEWRVLL